MASNQSFSTFTEIGMIDARTYNGIITLPVTSSILGRVVTLKDIYGASSNSTITISTTGLDVFEDGSSSKTFNTAFESMTLYAGQPGYWYTLGGSLLNTANIGTLSTGVIKNPLRVGTISSQSYLAFYGLTGGYTNTVIAEQSTGTGSQELFLFKGSSPSDRIRLTTTGQIAFETQVTSQLFGNNPAQGVPTMLLASNLVGIGTSSIGSLLDVGGQGRFIQVSTQNINVSSINGQTFGGPINSTSIGLGTLGYVSTVSLISTVQGLGSANYVSTASLNVAISSFSTAFGPGGVAPYNLTSTVQGLGSANYVSSATLSAAISSFSTAFGPGGVAPYNLTSTVQGLGTVGYVSSSQLLSSVNALSNYASSISTFDNIFVNVINGTGPTLLSLSTTTTLSLPAATVDLLIVGGGGGGGSGDGGTGLTPYCGGGGAGGSVYLQGVRVPAGSYTFTVGIGGSINTNGSNSSVTINGVTYTGFGGGYGAQDYQTGGSGGCGGGGGGYSGQGGSASQGFRGGTDTGGGGGMGSAGQTGGGAGAGLANAITGVPVTYSRGGSGGVGTGSKGTDGLGNGGDYGASGGSGKIIIRFSYYSLKINASVDISGQSRFQTVSTLALNISSINGQIYGDPSTLRGVVGSTVQGLGSAGYISSLSGLSTISTQNINVSSINGQTFGGPINSTTLGLGTLGYISTASLISSIQGLGTSGYISTANLQSTVLGLNTYISSFIDVPELTSTIIGLGTSGYVSTTGLLSTASGLASYIVTFINPNQLASTVVGLGTANYISSLTLTYDLQSSIVGLGNTGYISTSQLTSTVAGIGSASFASTISTSYGTSFTTSNLNVSSITGNNANLNQISSGFITLSSVNLVDQTTQAIGNIYENNALLYFNKLVFAGARVGPGQFLYPR
jgi:hypothetical protein